MEFTSAAPMFNSYPDSIGGNLKGMLSFLKEGKVGEAFGSYYILPSIFHTDLDRGFSVIDYGLCREYAEKQDLEELKAMGIDLKLDFILNHASVLSPQFQHMLKEPDSPYKDFFINWNTFWDGYGTMTEEGYIKPDEKYLKNMFFRKPGLPILMVRMPDGTDVPYWNTFYQQVTYLLPTVQQLMGLAGIQYATAQRLHAALEEGLGQGKKPNQCDFSACPDKKELLCQYLEGRREYLGQMDLNIRSPLVWRFYEDTLRTLAAYGASIVRLDAFAYAPKEPGEKNFLNEPGTWELLERVNGLAKDCGLQLLPEIHASYQEGIYEKVAEKGYLTYDFFLPGLLIDALEFHESEYLCRWAEELVQKKIRVVNMLGCHDGIPLLDLKGLIPEERIQTLIDTVVARGGLVKNLHGAKNMYYQVNAAYYSALGESPEKMVLARAIQLFMPGKPQVWYLDLLLGKNDYQAVDRAGPGGHKEINRTNLTTEEAQEALGQPAVQEQLKLLALRKRHPAFGFDSQLTVHSDGPRLTLAWRKDDHEICLEADLERYTYTITGTDL